LTPEEFEQVLARACEILTENVRTNSDHHSPDAFERHALDMLKVAADARLAVEPSFHPHAFPDIRANGYGVEVKFTKHDTWLAIGNSIFEGMRDPDVSSVYVLYGKIGGEPEVRWGRYEQCVTHVRVSNAPRFVIEMDARRTSLFENMGVSYDEFSKLDDDAKMHHVREYSRGRLKKGERLWWLEASHSLPMQVRFYTSLRQSEKRRLRAEAALLCPQVCGGPRLHNKYTDAALYLLMHHGVFCHQARDLFSAGSVALRADDARGGNYIFRALKDIEELMREAAGRIEDSLIVEYWGATCVPCNRIREWLRRADNYAQGWRPSEELFLHDQDHGSSA